MGTGQKSVALAMAGGVVGEIILDGPHRAQPGVIDSDNITYPNNVGYAYTQAAADGHCVLGGTGVFFGFLANPKVYPLFGTSSGALAPSLALPQYSKGEFVYDATGIVVALPAACAIGALVDYDTTTGALSTRLGVQPSTGAQRVALVAATGVATVSLTPAGAPPIGIGSVMLTADGQRLTVVALGTGTGGDGTYVTTGATADHAAEAFSYTSVPASGKASCPGFVVVRQSLAGAGLGIIGNIN